jgi:hypothetical protein
MWPFSPRPSLPEPLFNTGDFVRTLAGEINGCVVKTPLTARVRYCIWHHKRKTWVYFLDQKRGRRGRWYLECQLARVNAADQ